MLDGLSGGDERMRRRNKGKGKVVDGSDGVDEQRELDVVDERGRSRGDAGPEGEGEVRPFVNGSFGHS